MALTDWPELPLPDSGNPRMMAMLQKKRQKVVVAVVLMVLMVPMVLMVVSLQWCSPGCAFWCSLR